MLGNAMLLVLAYMLCFVLCTYDGPWLAVLQVEQVTEVPGGMMPAVHVEGLHPPLSLTLRQYQDVTQLKVSLPWRKMFAAAAQALPRCMRLLQVATLASTDARFALLSVRSGAGCRVDQHCQ